MPVTSAFKPGVNIMEKRILCYGDSNTWGYIAGLRERFPKDVRWTGRLAALLGEEYTVIEEGLNARTTVFQDPVDRYRCGYDYLYPCLLSHAPLDVVILMLGTNDLKKRFHAPVRDIASGAGLLAKMAMLSETGRSHGSPRILLVSPIHVGEEMTQPDVLDDFGIEAVNRSKTFAQYYRTKAAELGIDFLDAAQYAQPGRADCIHLDEQGHRALAQAIFQKLQEMGIEHPGERM